ncbi:DoxX family membrane protein [Pseudenhygromyxa sp. WMMC2535]|uniref:DoxX family protein n=1 Tax=Pseudenhygromyxa sp. WMMC2535 TaxID=2712867 RepID=UPI001552B53D|nr:DoxX family membrane protein [Pseudenhygromyxa sp. WMMC2535]NVB39941.1 DoxX family membrane protein [Pseudenhygromyxa sp. WMMC2535]
MAGVRTVIPSTIKTTKIQDVFRILLGLMMVLPGIGHMTFQRLEFQAQVPGWIPLDPDLVVILSGVVEVGLGAAMLFAGKWKVWVGLTLATFYVLIFPGNIHQYTHHIDAFGLDSDRARLIRLLFQPLLIAWALWSTGALRALRGRGEVPQPAAE